MPELLALLIVLLVGLLMLLFWNRLRLQRRAVERFEVLTRPDDAAPPPPPARPFLRSRPWLPWLVGLLLGGGLYVLVRYGPLPAPSAWAGSFLAITAGVMVGLLGSQVEALLRTRRTLLIQTQLADALDLMIAALRAGSSLLNALDSAVRETRAPLRAQLEEVLGRIRFGEDAQAVLQGLTERVPLETFQLFTATLSVHWEVGGSLGQPLASVARSIRDRIEISRRIRSLTTQARSSLWSVLVVTYAIALIMWRSDPERMREFLSTTIGVSMVCGAVLLQAVGIAWSSVMTRIRF